MAKPIKVVFSSLNVAMTSGALRGPEWLNDYAAAAGCEGVEYMPMLDLVWGHTPRAIGKAVAKGTLDLNSLHASFREGKASAATNRMPGDPQNPPSLTSRLLGGPLGSLIVPEVCQSASVMGAIQEEAGKNVPVVLYPQADPQVDKRQIIASKGGSFMFQPTDHVARLVGAENLAVFDNEMGIVRGYGYVFDTYHGRRQYGREEPGVISDVDTSVSYLANNTHAIHLSLNRADIPGEPHIPTRDEGRKALQGVYDGQLRGMLDVLKEVDQAEYVVIEATAPAIADLTGYNKQEDIQKAYADIAHGFQDYWQAA